VHRGIFLLAFPASRPVAQAATVAQAAMVALMETALSSMKQARVVHLAKVAF
jgi:hypothetical protein